MQHDGLETSGAFLIDINMGCPVRKIAQGVDRQSVNPSWPSRSWKRWQMPWPCPSR